MPVKPSAVGNVSPYLWSSASSGPMPTRPAIAPHRDDRLQDHRFGLTPAGSAAAGFAPVVRRSKPKRVR